MKASLVASLLIICLALISVSCSGTATEEPIQGSGGLETTGSIPIVTPSPAIDPSTDSDDSGDVDIGSNTNQTDSPASITTTDPDPKSTETPAASPTPTPTESTAANGPLTDNALSHDNLENTESVCSQSAIGTGTVPPPTVLPTSSKITAYQPIPVNSPCGNYPKITLRDWGESARSFESRRYYSNHFLEWTPDGDQIILNVPDKGDLFGSGVHLVNLDGPPHRYLVDANPGYSMRRGFQADLSPDGTMLVYTTCEFAFNGTTLLPEDLESYDQRRARKDYDLAILGIYDGTKRLLTKSSDTIYTGENPAWSSDGSQIAFLARKRSDYEGSLRLVTKNADGSDTRIIVPFKGREMIIRRPPAWSSDGNYIAFLQVGGPNRSSEYLYTVKQDGSELYGIARVTSLPSWAPEGSRLAFGHRINWNRVANQEETAGLPHLSSTLCMVELDDNGHPSLSSITPIRAFEGIADVRHVNWSPDGEDILLIVDEGDPHIFYNEDGVRKSANRVDRIDPPLSNVYLVRPDGTGLRKLVEEERPYSVSAWSHDSSLIALRVDPQFNRFDRESRWEDKPFIDEFEVIIVDRDGDVKNVLSREEILGGKESIPR